LRRAAAGGVQRDERIEQERNVVTARVDIALVDVNHVGQGVEVVNGRTVGVVNHRAVGAAIGRAEDLAQRFTVGVLDRGVIELAAHDEVDGFAVGERLLGQRGHVWADEAHLQIRIRFFHARGQLDVAGEAGRAGEQHQEPVVLADLDGLFRADVMRRSVEHAGTFQHAGRIGQPHRVPVGLNLASSRPTRTGAAVVILERGWIQKECLQRHSSVFNFTIS
jgi:hypothetical protein